MVKNFSRAIRYTLTVTTLLLANNAIAVPTSEKYEVLKKASNYAQSVACSTTFSDDTEDTETTISDVYLVETSSFDDLNEFGTNYIVYWSGDYGCMGGSGTYSSFLTSFSRISDTRPFLMEKLDILDDINKDKYQINSRFIHDVDFKNGVLLITASDYSNDPNDFEANNFPANRYLYVLSYDEDVYEWKLLNKQFIGKND